jgi:hypothetical protein
VRQSLQEHKLAGASQDIVAKLISILDDGAMKTMRNHATGLPSLTLDIKWLPHWQEIGRHHGLITRLLDWSLSPFVAAFFAIFDVVCGNSDLRSQGYVSESLQLDGKPFAVWEFAVPESLAAPGHHEFALFKDRHAGAYRQKAQQGVFTKLETPAFLDLEAFLTSKSLAHHLVKFVVPSATPGSTAVRALRDLELMNISWATLSPDLDGAALQSNLDSTRKALSALEAVVATPAL